jgi:hypothetical protein
MVLPLVETRLRGSAVSWAGAMQEEIKTGLGRARAKAGDGCALLSDFSLLLPYTCSMHALVSQIKQLFGPRIGYGWSTTKPMGVVNANNGWTNGI